MCIRDSHLSLAVTDNGTGLSAEKLQELEEKPHYMESTDERLDLRHGLGLQMCIRDRYRTDELGINLQTRPSGKTYRYKALSP